MGGGGVARDQISDIRHPKNQISDIRPPKKIKYQISQQKSDIIYLASPLYFCWVQYSLYQQIWKRN